MISKALKAAKQYYKYKKAAQSQMKFTDVGKRQPKLRRWKAKFNLTGDARGYREAGKGVLYAGTGVGIAGAGIGYAISKSKSNSKTMYNRKKQTKRRRRK